MVPKKRAPPPKPLPEVQHSPHVKTNGKMAQVERMAACGLDEQEIAYCMQVDVVTLRANYADQLQYGTASVVAKVGGAMIKSALRGDTNAGQFILRARARWVTPTKIEQDVTVTVEDKRRLMDKIVTRMQRTPVTLEHQQAMDGAKPEGRAN